MKSYVDPHFKSRKQSLKAVYFFLFHLLRNELLINFQLTWTGNCKENIHHPPRNSFYSYLAAHHESCRVSSIDSFWVIWCHLQTCWKCTQSHHLCHCKDVKVYWSQDGLLGDTILEWPLPEHEDTDNSLAMTILSILYPLDSLAFKSIFI